MICSRKNWITNGCLLIGSLFLFFLVIEFGLRVTGLQTVKPNPPKIYQVSDDPRISYELIPNISRRAYRQKVTTNNLGFRSPSITDEPLIAVLGDSITFGYGVKNDETLPARIDERLDGYQVLNTAVPAYQLEQETATYETKVAALDPAALILVFYFNDLTTKTAWLDDDGIVRGQDWKPEDDTCQPIEEGIIGLLPGRCWLDLNSAFYKAFKKLVNMRHMKEQLAATRQESQQNPEEDDVTDEQLSIYANQLDDLVALLPSDMPRLFVIWPDRYLHTPSRPKVINLAEQRGFVTLDLYETFGNEAETLGWDTVHPSAKTIDEAAELIVQTIRENAMLEGL